MTCARLFARCSTTLQNSAIPWRELIGTRNRLIHGYDAVDHDILWTIVADDFRPLAEQIKVLLKD